MATVRKRTWTTAKGEQRSAWVADYFDQNHKRHEKAFPTKKAAKAWLVKAQGEVSRGIHTPERNSITLAEAAARWLERGQAEAAGEEHAAQLRAGRAPLCGSRRSRAGQARAIVDAAVRGVARPAAREDVAATRPQGAVCRQVGPHRDGSARSRRAERRAAGQGRPQKARAEAARGWPRHSRQGRHPEIAGDMPRSAPSALGHGGLHRSALVGTPRVDVGCRRL